MISGPQKLHGLAGIDEAGRGPMIGPMVICGLLFDEDPETRLLDLGIKDSKQLTPVKREGLYYDILHLTARFSIRRVTASKIDELRSRGLSLNEIELQQFISITKSLEPRLLIVDAVDVKAERFGTAISERSKLGKLGMVVVSEHRADLRYPIVSAASIIAKVQRDRIIKQLHQEYGDFGSGYPSDPKTVSFLRNLLSNKEPPPPIVRMSWESVRRIVRQLATDQATPDSY